VAQTGVEFVISAARSLVMLSSPLGTSREIARVTFDGGYVLPGTAATAGQTALPAELESACLEQTAYLYQRKDQLGLVSVSGEGGSVSQFSSLDLLPGIKKVLEKYERWRA